VDGTAALVVAGSIFLWGVLSARLQRADLTAPILFVAVGAVVGAWGSSRRPRTRRA
jgi:hypothetical protein